MDQKRIEKDEGKTNVNNTERDFGGGITRKLRDGKTYNTIPPVVRNINDLEPPKSVGETEPRVIESANLTDHSGSRSAVMKSLTMSKAILGRSEAEYGSHNVPQMSQCPSNVPTKVNVSMNQAALNAFTSHVARMCDEPRRHVNEFESHSAPVYDEAMSVANEARQASQECVIPRLTDFDPFPSPTSSDRLNDVPSSQISPKLPTYYDEGMQTRPQPAMSLSHSEIPGTSVAQSHVPAKLWTYVVSAEISANPSEVQKNVTRDKLFNSSSKLNSDTNVLFSGGNLLLGKPCATSTPSTGVSSKTELAIGANVTRDPVSSTILGSAPMSFSSTLGDLDILSDPFVDTNRRLCMSGTILDLVAGKLAMCDLAVPNVEMSGYESVLKQLDAGQNIEVPSFEFYLDRETIAQYEAHIDEMAATVPYITLGECEEQDNDRVLRLESLVLVQSKQIAHLTENFHNIRRENAINFGRSKCVIENNAEQQQRLSVIMKDLTKAVQCLLNVYKSELTQTSERDHRIRSAHVRLCNVETVTFNIDVYLSSLMEQLSLLEKFVKVSGGLTNSVLAYYYGNLHRGLQSERLAKLKEIKLLTPYFELPPYYPAYEHTTTMEYLPEKLINISEETIPITTAESQTLPPVVKQIIGHINVINIPPNNLAPFHGRLGDNFEEWTHLFTMFAGACDWPSDRWNKILGTYLRDAAQESYQALPQEVKDGNFDCLVQRLASQLQPVELERVALRKLHVRKQQIGETVSDFAWSIQKLVRCAYPSMDVDHREQVMMNHFLEGLLEKYKRHLLYKDPLTFKQAVEMVQKFEVFEYPYNSTAKRPVINQIEFENEGIYEPLIIDESGERKAQSRQQITAVVNKCLEEKEHVDKLRAESDKHTRLATEINALSEKVQQLEQHKLQASQSSHQNPELGFWAKPQEPKDLTANASRKAFDPTSVTCFRCGKTGHIARNCNPGLHQTGVSCYRCGKKGHIARNCRSATDTRMSRSSYEQYTRNIERPSYFKKNTNEGNGNRAAPLTSAGIQTAQVRGRPLSRSGSWSGRASRPNVNMISQRPCDYIPMIKQLKADNAALMSQHIQYAQLLNKSPKASGTINTVRLVHSSKRKINVKQGADNVRLWIQPALLFILVIMAMLVGVNTEPSIAGLLGNWTSQVYPQIGLSVDPAGLVILAPTSSYIPIVVHLNRPELMKARNPRSADERCQAWNNVYANINSTMSEMKQAYEGVVDPKFYQVLLRHLCDGSELCAPSKPINRLRRKRGIIGMAAGAIGLAAFGVGIRNSIEIGRLQSKVEAVDLAMAKMSVEVGHNRKMIETLREADENLYAFLHHSMDRIYNSMVELKCEMLSTQVAMQQSLLIFTLTHKVKEMINRILKATMDGSLSPDVLSIERVKSLVLTDSIFQGTLYQNEPSLIYRTGRVYPVRMDLDHLTFGFILEIPMVRVHHVAPLFQTTNVGWHIPRNDMTYKLDVPHYAVIQKSGLTEKYKEITPQYCDQHLGLWVCSIEAVSKSMEAKCLGTLIKRTGNGKSSYPAESILQIPSCTYQSVGFLNNTEIRSTRSGILLRTNETSVRVSRDGLLDEVKDTHPVVLPRNGVFAARYGEFGLLSVGSKTIVTSHRQIRDVHIEVRHIPEIKLDQVDIVPLDWTDMNAAKAFNEQTKKMLKREVPEFVSMSQGLAVTNATLLYIGVGIAVFITCFCVCKLKVKPYVDDLRETRRAGLAFRQTQQDRYELREVMGLNNNPATVNVLGEKYSEPVYSAVKIICRIEGVPIMAMVDTGASLTMMDYGTYLGLPCMTDTLDGTNLEVSSYTGHNVEVLGIADLVYEIGHHRLVQKTYVARGTSQPVILGMDCLTNFRLVSLDFVRHTLTLDSGDLCTEVELQHDPRQIPNLYINVCLPNKVKIPPLSQALVPCDIHVPKSYADTLKEVPVMVHPSPNLASDHKVLMANTVQYLSDNNPVLIRIVNPSVNNVSLSKGVSVAIAEPVVKVTEPETGSKETSEVKAEALTKIGLDLNNCAISSYQQGELIEMLYEYLDIFAKSVTDYGRTPSVKHYIDTQGHAPIKLRPYRVPFHLRDEVNQHVQKMLDDKIIRPSVSPWSAPVVLVQKVDGTLRFCVDYRGLNEITKKFVYPLPRIEDILDNLSNAKYFTTLDMISGYWSVDIAEEDREKTAFTTFMGHYEFNQMPFGLTNAPSTFQNLIDVTLAGLLYNTCFAYIDDVIIASQTWEQHLLDTKAVLKRLRCAGLKLKLKKCMFAQSTVAFLCHIIDQTGIKPDPSKIEKVVNFPVPHNLTTLRSFLGLCSYYRKFVEGFSKIATPLLTLLQKNNKFAWSENCQKAFDELKIRLTTAPVLVYPNFDKRFYLYTDASGTGLGAVLSQQIEGKDKPVAYASRALSKTEKNYAAIQLELLAIVWAIRLFRTYLLGREFSVITDHAPLKYLMSQKNPQGKMARWAMELLEYNFCIEHRSGKRNANADCLSRMHISKVAENVENPVEVNVISSNTAIDAKREKLISEQKLDPWIKPIRS